MGRKLFVVMTQALVLFVATGCDPGHMLGEPSHDDIQSCFSLGQSQPEKAIDGCNGIISRWGPGTSGPGGKDVADAYEGRGIAYATLHQYDSALSDLRVALQREPDDILGNRYLCQVNLDAKRYDDAVAACNRELALKPDDTGAADALRKAKEALAAGGTGGATSPVTPASVSASQAPQSAVPATNDAEMLFWQSVMNSKNEADYEAYLRSYPHGRFVALAKARIEQLQGAPR